MDNSLVKLRRLVELRRQFLNKRTDIDVSQKDAVDFELSYLHFIITDTILKQETDHAG
jgi:hypothetical protein